MPSSRFLWLPTALSLGLLSTGVVVAQRARPLTEPPEFALDQWTTEDGLPQNSVTAIARAPDGYLWVGTFGGLARFDGRAFRLMERVDSTGRHIDRVLSLSVGPDGALWIGTENGLLRYHNERFEVYTTADGLPDNRIPILYVDRAGVLWIGTERDGIARLVDGRFGTFAEVNGAPFGPVTSITEDTNGTLWIGAGNRIVTIEGGRPSSAEWHEAPVSGASHMALQDRAAAHWYSHNDGLARVSGARIDLYGQGDGVPGRASIVAEDPGGGYWLGTSNDGLFFLQPDGHDAVVHRYALPDGRRGYRLRSAYVDAGGSVWFGTDANGLLRARRNLFTTYTTAHGLSHDVATAVHADAGGAVWVGTNCFGVNAVDRSRRTVQIFKPRMPNDPAGDPCVFALTESPAGTMWVGTWGGGLSRVTGNRADRLGRVAGLRDSVVVALFADRDGVVWVGTNSGGLAAFDGERVAAVYTTEDGLAHNSVRTIYQTRDGALWIGTLEGLSRFVDGRFTTYTAPDGLSAVHIRAIHEDAAGRLWIGTYGGGLNHFRDGVFTSITERDGLSDDVVSSILEDDQGRFWMSGNRGIFRVARSDLVTFADGRLSRVHSVLYGRSDGLLRGETNGGFQPSATRDARGHLWFPTVEGVAVVDPSQATAEARLPPVAVQEVVVDGVARSPADEIVVGPGRPNLEFRYAGLSLSTPEHVTYRYRLEGFDPSWVQAGSRQVAYYPRLPSGRYRFVVTAANRDGVWNETETRLRLRVLQPFWSTWWFRLAGVGGLLAVGTALVRRREVAVSRDLAAREEFSRRLMESQEQERRRIAGELHDGLGQELLVVKNRTLLALGVNGLNAPVRNQLQSIAEVVGHSLDNVRGLAHNLTPYQLDHLGLSAALRAMIDEVADTAEIAFDITVDEIDDLLSAADQINLYRIVQEGVANIVRHSGANTAVVRVRRVDHAISVSIVDDGSGFVVQRDGQGRLTGGFGMTGIAERVRILGGRVGVVSGPGRGTRIELDVPAAPVESTGGQ